MNKRPVNPSPPPLIQTQNPRGADAIIQEFQHRRSQFFSTLKNAFLVLVPIGLASFAVGQMQKNEDWYFGAFGAFVSLILVFTWKTYSIYRCPNCETVPMSRNNGRIGVNLSPEVCPSCGVALVSPNKPEYNLFHLWIGRGVMLIGFIAILSSGYLFHNSYQISQNGVPVELKIIKKKGKGKAARIRYRFSYRSPASGETEKFWIRGGAKSQSIGKRNLGDIVPGLFFENKVTLNNPMNLWLMPIFLAFFGSIAIVVGRQFILSAKSTND